MKLPGDETRWRDENTLLPGPSKGCQMVLRGVNQPSLRVYLAPLGRCWYISLYLYNIAKRDETYMIEIVCS